MARIRVFVSFDREHDADLVALLRAQATRPDSTFELLPSPQGGPNSELSEDRARGEIRAADEVVVICGEHTYECARITAELRIAREEVKPYLLLWGRRAKMCTKPEGATPADAMYSWTRDVLESQIAMVLENAKPRPIPENCKRLQA